ncbi:MAG TPA: hypothetical protein VGL94_20135 [Ktedonobacteraceae bacterium]
MELLIWLEQVYVWQLQRKEKEAMFSKRNDEKITDNGGTGYSSRKQLDMYTKAAREYEQGLVTHMENDDDLTTQSVINEIKVRAIDDARNGKRR